MKRFKEIKIKGKKTNTLGEFVCPYCFKAVDCKKMIEIIDKLEEITEGGCQGKYNCVGCGKALTVCADVLFLCEVEK